jgi:predicted dienelactone hydrolase
LSYDPFQRGPHPVGVRTYEFIDEARDRRRFPVEVWYPADPSHRGQDLDDATADRFEVTPDLPVQIQRAIRAARPGTGRHPLVAYFHGARGDRRRNTNMTTHLASHGYVVASPSFRGDTQIDPVADPISQVMGNRPLDARAVLDLFERTVDADIAALADLDAIGTCGNSFGGWTALRLNEIDPRPEALLAIVPAVGTSLGNRMDVDVRGWGRPVPTTIVAGDRDALVPLRNIEELFHSLAEPKRLAVLSNAGHAHFADQAEQRHENLRATFRQGSAAMGLPPEAIATVAEALVPFSELCPAEWGTATANSLCLAHMDAHLKGLDAARDFLAHDLSRSFENRGIDLRVR